MDRAPPGAPGVPGGPLSGTKEAAETMQHLCYNCFQEIPEREGTCPYCGFDLEENIKDYPNALRAGTVLNQRYLIGRVLGQGGFGITYLAFDTKLEAKVAVKEFMPNDIATRIGTTVSVAMKSKSEEFTYGAERFQEEARTLAKFMGQPNIAGVTDYFDENDTSYFVMDYIEGISFKTYIANHGGKITVEDALNVMIPVLRALTAVHAEGFIHRDVTPDNIYITKDGMVKLLDFGSARYSIGDKSKSLDVILKVGYAPKEQYIRRSRQGPFTDVYSCAACFYAAITGFLPPESLERMDQDTLVPISQQGIEIPEYLDKAILKGLAVQPEDRFQSAAEFLEAIERQQVVEVPSAAPAAPAVQAKKKRTPLLIAGAAVLIAVVFALGALFGGGGGSSGENGGTGGGNPITEALAPKITIAGEEYSTALTELKLRGAGLTNEDIVPLSQMTDLEVLSLEDNPDITDLSPLEGLTGLTALNLMGTGATDLGPIAGLTNLEQLELANPDLSDLTPLASLTNLKTLYLDDGSMTSSSITDLSPLAGLVNLEGLYLPSAPNYTDFSALSGMTQLKELVMMGTRYSDSNSIDSLDFLANMPKLERLLLSVRDVDLAPMAGAVSLVNVELTGGSFRVDDLSVFSNLTSLESLLLHRSGDTVLCSAQDLTALSGLTKLRKLDLGRVDGLTSLSGLESLVNLEELSLGTRSEDPARTITDLNPLAGLSKLRHLYLFAGTSANVNSPALDISALAGLGNLEYVNLFPSTRIVDQSPLENIPQVVLD